MGRAHHRHLETGRLVEPTKVGGWSGDMVKDPVRIEDKEYATTLCGEKLRTDYKWQASSLTEDVAYVTCPKCSRKLGAQALKARDASAGKLEIVQDKEAKAGFRYEGGWKVVLDGETIGYVGFQDHYWRIYKLECHETTTGDGPEIYLPYGPVKEDGRSDSRTIQYGVSNDVPRYRSRDAAALACEQFYRQGIIKDAPALIAAWHADRAEWRRQSAERQRQNALAREAKDHAREALESVLDRAVKGEIALTNFERAGLETALATYPKKDEQP